MIRREENKSILWSAFISHYSWLK